MYYIATNHYNMNTVVAIGHCRRIILLSLCAIVEIQKNIRDTFCVTLPCSASHCCTLLHTATYCCTLLHTSTHCCTLLHTAAHCCTLQHTAAHCCTLLHTAAHCWTLQCRSSEELCPCCVAACPQLFTRVLN